MKRFFAAALALLILAPSCLWAAEVKIGYVDLQKALNLSETGKKAKEQIAAQFKTYEGELRQRQEELKKLKDELERQAVLLSEEARADKEREYQKKLKDYERFGKDMQDELRQKDAGLTKQILEEIFAVINEIGEKEGFALILEYGKDRGILERTDTPILYAPDRIDLTDQVIKAYDAKTKKRR